MFGGQQTMHCSTSINQGLHQDAAGQKTVQSRPFAAQTIMPGLCICTYPYVCLPGGLEPPSKALRRPCKGINPILRPIATGRVPIECRQVVEVHGTLAMRDTQKDTVSCYMILCLSCTHTHRKAYQTLLAAQGVPHPQSRSAAKLR